MNAAAKQEMRLFFHLRLGRDIFSLQNTVRQGMGSQRWSRDFETTLLKLDLKVTKMN